jgi:hypothetical protein
MYINNSCSKTLVRLVLGQVSRLVRFGQMKCRQTTCRGTCDIYCKAAFALKRFLLEQHNVGSCNITGESALMECICYGKS